MAELKPRIPDPKRYSGDNKTLEVWLYSLKVYFNAIGWEYDGDDSDKCGQYTVALLEGAALQWHHRQFLNGHAESEFNALERELKQQFGILDVERRARNSLRNLVQRSSVADYVKQFEQVVMHLPQATQDELQHAFIYGLKPHVRAHVLLNAPSSINEAQTMALTVDDRQDSHLGFRPSNNKQGRNNGGTQGGRRNNDIVPMEIGNMSRSQHGKQKGKRKQGKPPQQQQRTTYSSNSKGKSGQQPPPNPCRHCGGNHWNKDCRSRQSQPCRYNNIEQQFNSLQLADSDGPETSTRPHWEQCSQCQQNLHHQGPSY